MRCLVHGFMLTLFASAAAAQEPPPIPLTSDTPQYCAQLAQQITQQHSASPDVATLLAEGRELCDQGEVRSGIRRLRRALVILDRHGEAPRPAQDDPDTEH